MMLNFGMPHIPQTTEARGPKKECHTLNPGKSQTLRISHKDTDVGDTLNILGVEINKTVRFNVHQSNMLTDLKLRVGVI